MVQTGFWIGNRDWWVMASLGVDDGDLRDVYEGLRSVGLSERKVREVCDALSEPNNGYTYTDYDGKYTLIYASRATSAEQMFDTIEHELNHAVEHISSYYGVDPKSEEASYLAGELGRLIWPAAAWVLCPRCRESR